MGLLQFCSIILSWAPSMIFTALNEHLNDLKIAMLAIFGFHMIGLTLLVPIDVSEAKASAKLTENRRFKGGRHATIRDSSASIGDGVELVEEVKHERNIV